MALTQEQVDGVNEVLRALDVEVNTICQSRDAVRGLLLVDTLEPDRVVDDMAAIQTLKSRASVAANNLVAILA